MWSSTCLLCVLCLLLATAVQGSRAEYQELLKSLAGGEPLHRHRRDTCGGTYTHETENKVITSPNYPNDYHNSANCYYNIEVPPGHYVEIEFEDFRIEIPRTSSSNCTYDGLAVRDGSVNVEPMGRYCGKVVPPDFRSRSNFVMLHLYSDESLGFRGFKLRYRVLCGGTFFSEHGTLRFLEGERHISETNSCDYELVASPDKYLDLNFTVNGLTVTSVQVMDHSEVVRTLRQDTDYTDMDVRVVSTSNIVRLRFSFSGIGEGNMVIAYQAHRRALLSGDPVFLFHMQTCRGLSAIVSGPESDRHCSASNVTKDAVAHRIEKVGGHQNDTLSPGDEVYVRTMSGGARPLSLSATRSGYAAYDQTAYDNSTWRLFGQLRHGGRVWLENKLRPNNFLGLFTDPADQQSWVATCRPAVDWVLYKVPLDFGWDKYEARGAFQARWVDGMAAAAYHDCLPHPLLFPHCGARDQTV